MGATKKVNKVANAVREAWLQSAERRALIDERDAAVIQLRHVAKAAAESAKALAETRSHRDAIKAQLMQDQAVLGQTLQEVKDLRSEVARLRGAPSPPAATNNTKENAP
jgi:hypothetical protein